MGENPWGGSEELWSQSAIELVNQGHKVGASVGYFGKPFHSRVKHLIDSGVKVYFRKNKIREYGTKVIERFTNINRLGYINNNYEFHINQFRPDLIVFSQASCYAAYPTMLYCLNQKIPYITISQLNTEMFWPNDKNYESIAEAFLGARKAFFVSKGNLNLLQRQLAQPLPNAKVFYAYPYLNYPEKLPWPSNETKQFAFVARLSFGHKGLDILLGAFANRIWKNRKFQLNIYGEGDGKLARQTSEFLGTHNVIFHGYAKNMQDIWQKNHILIMPSRQEGMPLTLIEAMFRGRPVIATDVAGHAELVEDGQTGFLVEAPTVNLLSQSLERAWKARSTWSELGIKAEKKVKEKYSESPVQDFINEILL